MYSLASRTARHRKCTPPPPPPPPPPPGICINLNIFAIGDLTVVPLYEPIVTINSTKNHIVFGQTEAWSRSDCPNAN